MSMLKYCWPLWCGFAVVISGLVLLIYVHEHNFDPESRFCVFKIYQQTNGLYQIWWGSTKQMDDATLEQAKARRKRLCSDFIYVPVKPTGTLVNP